MHLNKYLTAGLSLAGLAMLPQGSQVVASPLVPFSGQEQGAFISDLLPFVFPIAHDGVSGEGVATQIGHYSLTGTFVANVLAGTAAGPFIMTDDNGDKLFLDASGGVTPTDHSKVVWNLTVTGGTGRFENEVGSFTSQVQLTGVVGSISPNPYVATLEGALSPVPEGGPGSAFLAACSLAGFGLLSHGRKTAKARH